MLSYVLVGLLPYLVFSGFFIYQTRQQLRKNAEYGFYSAFDANAANVKERIRKLEDAVSVLGTDRSVAAILTDDYSSAFDQYFKVTQYFDSVLQTIMLSTPEITKIRFYVPNSLANTRVNFLSMDKAPELDKQPINSGHTAMSWEFRQGHFYLIQYILSPNIAGRFAILEAEVEVGAVFDPQLLGEYSYEASFSGEIVVASEEDQEQSAMIRETSLFGGQGKLTGMKSWDDFGNVSFFSGTAAVLGIVGAFCILLLVINLFSRKFVKRINRMNQQLSVTVQNNFETGLSEDFQDELGSLTLMINQMIADTRELIRDVFESKLKQREYEIKALQAQINPHFLYNTLSAINWHAITTRNYQISGIVTSLSQFYRTALNKGDSMTTIENELKNIRAYLNIQLSIHSNSFSVEYEIADGILHYYMPNLILQPIVENAIEHGIDQKTDGRGLLKIRGWEDASFIQFEITDNGAGIPEEIMKNLMTQKNKGYGLGNVNQRLLLFFGEKYEFAFHSGEETSAFLRIPKCGENGTPLS